MPVLRAGEPQRVEPGDQLGRPEAERIAYFLKVPAPLERTRFRQRVAALGGRMHSQQRLLAAVRDGVASILPDPADPDRLRHLAAIDAVPAAAARLAETAAEFGLTLDEVLDRRSAAPEPCQAALRDYLVALNALWPIEETVRTHVPSFAALCSENETYFEYVGHAAVEQLLVDWANVGPPFRRGPTGPPAELAELIPPQHLVAIGQAAQLLLTPTGRAAKNSDSPSPGGSAATTSETARNTRSKTRGAKMRGASRRSASRA